MALELSPRLLVAVAAMLFAAGLVALLLELVNGFRREDPEQPIVPPFERWSPRRNRDPLVRAARRRFKEARRRNRHT
jgi:hypothetical protein